MRYVVLVSCNGDQVLMQVVKASKKIVIETRKMKEIGSNSEASEMVLLECAKNTALSTFGMINLRYMSCPVYVYAFLCVDACIL